MRIETATEPVLYMDTDLNSVQTKSLMSSTSHVMPNQFNILLVDDVKANLLSLEELLQSPNRTFLKATSGNEALQLALKNKEIGLIMLDVQMPGMDGFEVAQHLQSNQSTSHIPIIFVTAINKEERFVLKGFQKGAVDYLPKPLNFKITRAKVDVFEKLYFNQKQLTDAIIEKERVNKQLERFMYVVSHDLKSPLTGIIALVSLLKEDERINTMDGIEDCLELLSSAASHSSQMINSLLEHSINTEINKSTDLVDTGQALEEVVKLLFLPKQAHIEIEGVMPVIRTSKLKLQQVFQNLISNSIKHNNKPNPLITIGVADKGTMFEFFVKDNGPGIAEADSKRVFNLFETASQNVGAESNTGVGLNIVKMNVTEQGGNIWVNSVLGEGSTFFFEWKK